MTIPTTPDAITVDWLQSALPTDLLGGGSITSVTTENIGEGTGVFGEIVRLRLSLEGGSSDGCTVVAKMPCVEPANLEVALMLGLYERELNMFDFALEQSPMRYPTRYFSERGDNGTFILLLEDLSDEFDVGDQVVGATLNQAEAVVDALAEFHAHWWESPELDRFEWLPQPDAPEFLAAVPPLFRAGMEPLQNDWGDRLPGAAIDLARTMDPRYEEIQVAATGGPRTLIHTDSRLDNVFFAKGDVSNVAFIDFQLCLKARGAADIAYLVGTSVPTELARNNWEALLTRWLDGITARGVTGYSFDDAVRHYRQSTLSYLSGPMSLIGTMDTANERGAAMTETWTLRAFNHAVDIDAASGI